MTEQNRWEGLFDEFLDVIEFRLVRYPTGWGVVDCQGANLGDIERDRFENAKSLIDRLDVYIQDYFIADIAEDAECNSYNSCCFITCCTYFYFFTCFIYCIIKRCC